MSGPAKALLWGVVLLVICAGGLFVANYAGLIELPNSAPPERVVVIGTAPDEEGTQLAVFAFATDANGEEVAILDTMAQATVSGTSAKTPLDAFPFGGGAMVARALAAQTGGQPLPWVVLDADSWASLIDGAGGVKVVVPEAVRSYSSGSLTQLERGSQVLSGQEAAALSGAVSYVGSEAAARQILQSLASGVSVLVAEKDALISLAASDTVGASDEFRRLGSQ